MNIFNAVTHHEEPNNLSQRFSLSQSRTVLLGAGEQTNQSNVRWSERASKKVFLVNIGSNKCCAMSLSFIKYFFLNAKQMTALSTDSGVDGGVWQTRQTLKRP